MVQYSPGGLIPAFEQRFARMYAQGFTVVIDGDCLSACTMVIGQMPGRVCATPRGRFGFHAAWQPTPFGKRPAPQGTAAMSRHWTPAVHVWLKAHGGLTPNIKLAPATEFVPACSTPSPAVIAAPSLTPAPAPVIGPAAPL